MTLGLGLSGWLLLAQAALPEAKPSPSPPVFEAGAELVTVDAVVVDGNGQPVGGLRREDFEIREDGHQRTIQSFEEVRLPEAPAAPAAPAERPRVSSNASPPPARTFVIVFDDLHLREQAAGQARKAVARFIDSGTRAGDRVVLVPTSSGRSWSDGMPQGRADLLALLDKMIGRAPSASGPDHVTEWEAMRIEVQRDDAVEATVLRRFYENGAIPECPPAGQKACSELQRSMAGSPQARMRAGAVYAESLKRRRATLDVLREVMESLVGMRGRKSVLLVSEGFVLEPTLREMHEVYEAARRANTAINFVDARGLFPVDTTLVDQGRVTQATGSVSGRPSNDVGLAIDQPRLLAEGTAAIADETGGERFGNTNDLGRGFDRLARESSIYYLIGYAPNDLKRDGKFRKIQVAVARPQTQVRARRGYVVPRETDLANADPRSPAPRALGDLPLRMAAYPLQETAEGKVRVLLAGEADASVFSWQAKDDRFEDAIDTTLQLLQRGAIQATSDRRLLELSLPAPVRDQVARNWLPILREVELAPGVYQAQLVVSERAGGLAGSVQHGFEVPAAGSFRLTSPILSDRLEPASGTAAARLSPLARRTFGQGSKLYCQFEVVNPSRAGQEPPRVRAGHLLRRVGGATLSQLEPTPLAPDAAGRLTRTLAISLRTTSPGPHELVLTVVDDATGRSVESVESFEVGPAVSLPEPTPASAVTAPAVSPSTGGVTLVDPRATLERADRMARAGGLQGRRWAIVAALMLDAMGHGADASSRLRSLAKDAPADPDVLLALGATLEASIGAIAKRPAEAAPAGSESLPDFQRRAAREQALREAEARYRGVLAARPADREARLRLGRVLQLRGDREASRILDDLARSESGDCKALALLFLADWHQTAGRLREALAEYRLAAQTAPHSQTAAIALAQALARSGDPSAAREVIESGLAAVSGLDPFLGYARPALRMGSQLVAELDQETTR